MPDLDSQLGSVSVDFRLGRTFMVFEHSRHSFIDPRSPQSIGDAMRTIEVARSMGSFPVVPRFERAAPPGKTSQNKKYLCASGSTVAGSQTSNSPSAVTR